MIAVKEKLAILRGRPAMPECLVADICGEEDAYVSFEL